MPGGVKVLCHHHSLELLRQGIDGRDDRAAAEQVKRTPFAKVVLYIDHDQSVVRTKFPKHAISPSDLAKPRSTHDNTTAYNAIGIRFGDSQEFADTNFSFEAAINLPEIRSFDSVFRAQIRQDFAIITIENSLVHLYAILMPYPLQRLGHVRENF